MFVATWHFVVAAASMLGLELLIREFWDSKDERFLVQVAAGVVIPLSVWYIATGVGILRWKNWSRISALVLNWVNLISAAFMFRRLPGNLAGILSALASCLVIWWLSVGATKAKFQIRTPNS